MRRLGAGSAKGPFGVLSGFSQSAARAFVVPGLAVLSGAAGLGYQVIWVRLLAVGLGHEAASVLAVIAAFFVGLALGGLAVDRLAMRTGRPGTAYAVLELAIALWALALIVLIGPANEMFLDALGAEPGALRWIAVSFLGPLFLLAPATIAMGATLPFLERLYARTTGRQRGVGLIYGANAGGAAIGAVVTLGLISPSLGFPATLAILAVLNVLCAAFAIAVPSPCDEAAVVRVGERMRPDPGLMTILFATGLLGVGLEVAVSRGLAQTLENTVFSFAAVVATYLIGAAIGSVWQGRARRRPGRDTLMIALAATSGWAALAIPFSGSLYTAMRAALGYGMPAEAVTTAAVFLPAASTMGALFAHLAQIARRPDGGLGAALAVNLLGGALAPVVVGLALVTSLGAVRSAWAIAIGYAVLAACATAARQRKAIASALAASTVAGLIFAPSMLVLIGPYERIVAHEEGTLSSASVVEGPDGLRRLIVDGRFAMGREETEVMDRLQGHAPLLLHPAPERALFLGLGTGATFAAAAAYPGLEAEAVELSPPVVELLPWFRTAWRDLSDPALSIHVGDARRWIRGSEERYDVIIADTFHPARDGASLLYTVEHFAAVRDRLAEGGLFAQWLPLHQFDLPTLRLVVSSFLEIYPDARMYMANASLVTPLIALVGRQDGTHLDLQTLMMRVQDRELARRIGGIGLHSPFDLLGGFIAGPEALRDFAGDAPPNTDAFPRVLFGAPASVYAPIGPAADRLAALINLPREPRDLLRLDPTARDKDFADRLAAYWQARDDFLELGEAAVLSNRPSEDAERLGPELLRVLAQSPDFGPPRRAILGLARALWQRDRESAVALLRAAQRIAPHPDLAAALGERS